MQCSIIHGEPDSCSGAPAVTKGGTFDCPFQGIPKLRRSHEKVAVGRTKAQNAVQSSAATTTNRRKTFRYRSPAGVTVPLRPSSQRSVTGNFSIFASQRYASENKDPRTRTLQFPSSPMCRNLGRVPILPHISLVPLFRLVQGSQGAGENTAVGVDSAFANYFGNGPSGITDRSQMPEPFLSSPRLQ